MAVEYYPLDYDAIKEGDVIPEHRIIQIVGAEPETDAFRLGQMNLVDSIFREGIARDKILTITTEKGVGIRILTPPEAAVYNRKMFDARVRGMKRDHLKNMAVDAEKLDEAELREHDRTLVTQGAYLQSLAQTKKRLRLTAATRQTPGKIEHSQDTE